MCGIAGGWFSAKQNEGRLDELANTMLNSIAHRGPDDGGYVIDDNVFIGNRRLKIFDLSDAGNQPFFSEDGQIWLVFNGEIYNHYELRAELDPEFAFHSHTDTEVLLRAYEKWGMNFLQKLNGMFAIAIWDKRKNQLILARDRVGIKPLFYHETNDSFLFASEIKALLMAGSTREPNLAIMKDYLVDGFYDHTDQTFFKDILQMKPGHYLVVSVNGIRQETYWNPASFVNQPVVKTGEIIEKYMAILNDAVRLRMRADVPYSVMLSGGLDSSMIASMASDHLVDHKLNVMTVRYDNPLYNEGPWADLVCEGKGWNEYNTVIDPSHVPELFGQALWHQDEPFGGVSIFGDMVLAEFAREHGIYVLLEGQGADETLGGYEYYNIYHLADLYEKDKKAAIEFYRCYAEKRDIPVSDPEKQLLDLINMILDPQEAITQDGTCPVRPDALSDDFAKHLGTNLQSTVTHNNRFRKISFDDLTATKLPRVIRFKDRSSMMHGVELRVPFLDHRLVELSFGISPEALLNSGYTKACFRKRMEDRLPLETCYHVKRQVQTPQREWLRTALKPIVDEVVHSESFSSRGLFDAKRVQDVYKEFINSPESYPNSFFVWQWLSIEEWYRMFIDDTNLTARIKKPAKKNTRRYPPK